MLASVAALGQMPVTAAKPAPISAAWSAPESQEHDASVEKKEVAEVLRPFWQSHRVDREPVLFVSASASGPATARLLFEPSSVLRVESGDGSTVYREGEDYRWERGSRTLTLVEGSHIPMVTEEQLFPPKGSPGSYGETKNGQEGLLFHEGGRTFQQMQVFVTYKHHELWTGFVPRSADEQLPATIAKLRAHKPLKLVVLGDSISHGACASDGFHGYPYQSPYPGLVAEALRAKYKDDVTLVNLSVGGKTSTWGISQAPTAAEQKPDLVVLAFGMNDATVRMPITEYAENTRRMMQIIRKSNPDVEFILVATMTGNPDWMGAPPAIYAGYDQALKELAGEGMAVADMTTMWDELVARKKFEDLTGNGINHPNDFGHMVYAQVIAAMLQGSTKER